MWGRKSKPQPEPQPFWRVEPDYIRDLMHVHSSSLGAPWTSLYLRITEFDISDHVDRFTSGLGCHASHDGFIKSITMRGGLNVTEESRLRSTLVEMSTTDEIPRRWEPPDDASGWMQFDVQDRGGSIDGYEHPMLSLWLASSDPSAMNRELLDIANRAKLFGLQEIGALVQLDFRPLLAELQRTDAQKAEAIEEPLGLRRFWIVKYRFFVKPFAIGPHHWLVKWPP